MVYIAAVKLVVHCDGKFWGSHPMFPNFVPQLK